MDFWLHLIDCVMCNNMGFWEICSLATLVAILVIFNLYFMLLSPEDTDILPMVDPRSFAVSAYSDCNVYFTILKFLLYIRPPEDGMTSEDKDFSNQKQGFDILVLLGRPGE